MNGKVLLIVGTVLFTAFIGSDLLFTHSALGDDTAVTLDAGSSKGPATKVNSNGAASDQDNSPTAYDPDPIENKSKEVGSLVGV